MYALNKYIYDMCYTKELLNAYNSKLKSCCKLEFKIMFNIYYNDVLNKSSNNMNVNCNFHFLN